MPDVNSLREQLREFHAATGHLIQSCPAVPRDHVVRLRARLIIEEAFEALEAMLETPAFERLKNMALYECSVAGVAVDIVKVADALGDIDYVVEGSRLSFGINGGPIAEEIHRANMAKLGGPKDEHGKLQKPPGWKPPDIAGELERQGWRRKVCPLASCPLEDSCSTASTTRS